MLSLTCRAFAAQSVLAARGCGEYQCDAPLTLLQSALDAARQANPDLVLWGGDTAPHLRRVRGSATLREDTDERQRAVLDTFTAASHVFKAMFPSTPVLPQLVRPRASARSRFSAYQRGVYVYTERRAEKLCASVRASLWHT